MNNYYGLEEGDFAEITIASGNTYLGTYKGLMELDIPFGTDTFIALDIAGKHIRYIRADEIVSVIRRVP